MIALETAEGAAMPERVGEGAAVCAAAGRNGEAARAAKRRERIAVKGV